MGSDMVNDLQQLLRVEMALHQLGYVKVPGEGVGAAMKVFSTA
jgi:hypothetical protein